MERVEAGAHSSTGATLPHYRAGREQQSGRWPAARGHYRLGSVLLQGLHADLIPDFHGQMEGAVGGGNATVDGAVDQHLLDLVTRHAIVARRLELHLQLVHVVLGDQLVYDILST